jgi:GEVED domain/Secretion system C-terminal sorting domain
MKRQAIKIIFFLLLLATMASMRASAQCAVGWNTATTKWDNLDYVVTTGNYSGFVTAAMAATQGFAIGRTGFTITYPGGITNNGDNVTNTAEAGSFGSGSDVSYNGNGTVTITFDTVVQNLKFSLYDIDALQTAQVKARDASGTALNITMTVVTAGINTVVGSGGTAPIATALVTAAANIDTKGTLNITIAGNSPAGTNGVKTVDIILGGTAGDWWLSDLSACVFGSFPLNYFSPLQPFTGTPTYVIATSDTNTVSLVNVATGTAKMIFQDATSPKYINALGFDHINRDLYYVWDFTATPANNKTLRKYNFATQTMSTVIADITTLGVPVYNRGVESAGCAFYDGNLYFGIEGNKSGNSGGRENTIWRISFNGAGVPTIARQTYSTPSDNGGGTLMHDWGDFAVTDGMIYDFNSASASGNSKFTHYNMQTGLITNVYPSTMPIPRQTGIIWNSTLYNVYDSIGAYNGAGGVGPRIKITGATGNDWFGTCGDATGYRPKYDLGDAPATYDPVALSPALHDKDTTLRIGLTWDDEFDKQSSIPANGDGADEDGLASVPIFSPGAGNYLASVTVYNHTGANATLCAWLDYNGNGVFDAGEGITQVVASSTSMQSKFLYWPSAPTPLPNGSYTYLRIRITSAANGMTTANPTGFFANGEVEDYRVVVDNFPLSVNILSFEAKAINNQSVKINWSADEKPGFAGYEVERSADANSWTTINITNVKGDAGVFNYQIYDALPIKGKSYYRLKLKETTGKIQYSEVRIVNIKDAPFVVKLVPNPAKTYTTVNIISEERGEAQIRVISQGGSLIHSKTLTLNIGVTGYDLPLQSNWPSGLYIVQVTMDGKVSNTKLIINK